MGVPSPGTSKACTPVLPGSNPCRRFYLIMVAPSASAESKFQPVLTEVFVPSEGRAHEASHGQAAERSSSRLTGRLKRFEITDLPAHFRKCPWADRCAPVSSSSPDRKAQNMRVTESENGP